jgi:TolA-binding protein
MVVALALVLLTSIFARGATPAELRDWKDARMAMAEKQSARAETNLANFIQTYPLSEHLAEAILYQAQARFDMALASNKWTFGDVISLLRSQQDRAGNQRDGFAYQIAEAHYYSSDFKAAAEGYAQVAQDFTNSAYRTKAIFNEAKAFSNLGDWKKTIQVLRDPAGTFQQTARTNAEDEWVVRGLFLLGEAELMEHNPAAAAEALQQLPEHKLDPDLEWRRQYLWCRIRMEGGHAEEAIQNWPSLLAAAEGADLATRTSLKAKSFSMLAELHRSLEHWTNAISAYQTNLTSDLPEERRLAMLNIVELNLRQKQTDEAAKRLEEFLARYPEERNRDFEILMLGELRLKQHFDAIAAGPARVETNLLQQARTNFLDLLADYTNSAFAGKAQLNLGWCWLEDRKQLESQNAFSNAVNLLTAFPEDRAVALFKLGDAQYQQRDYARAVSNYTSLIDQYGTLTAVKNELIEPALYQILRAGIAANDLGAATNAMRRLLDWFPGGPWGERGVLLMGQALSGLGQASDARAVFTDFISRWPESSLRPEVELAIARTYEREDNWAEAARRYNGWIATVAYSNNPAMPEAEFNLAWAEFKAGNDARAFSLFTNYVVRYQSNERAPRAQFWIGEYYRQQTNMVQAEIAYQRVTNWPTSDLTYLALMNAGRAAVGRQGGGLTDAINYFKALTANKNCPLQLRLEALFATADATVQQAATSTTNLQQWRDAVEMFNEIVQRDPSNQLAACAWARIGDCSLQRATQDLTQYPVASNAYEQVIASPVADVTLRSAAEFGLGQVLEKMAHIKQSPDAQRRPELAQLAIEHYLNIVNGRNLRDNETIDRFWVKEAGLAAGKLLEEDAEWGDWDKAQRLYLTMSTDLPEMRNVLERKLENVRKHLAPK